MAGLAARILSYMALALGLLQRNFEPFVDRHTSAIRALRYPDLGGMSPESGQLRAGAHTGYGTLTLLRQDSAPDGLEVRGVDGGWNPVPSVRGAFVVNIGDALERWSNDRWRSALHRVAVPPRDSYRDSNASVVGVLPQRELGRSHRVLAALQRCRSRAALRADDGRAAPHGQVPPHPEQHGRLSATASGVPGGYRRRSAPHASDDRLARLRVRRPRDLQHGLIGCRRTRFNWRSPPRVGEILGHLRWSV
jgi:hypothetical protein